MNKRYIRHYKRLEQLAICKQQALSAVYSERSKRGYKPLELLYGIEANNYNVLR